ncbi:MAG TPA: iron-siderophore ABC transporter substrate-binding protein [Eoetvoesiella sp.]
MTNTAFTPLLRLAQRTLAAASFSFIGLLGTSQALAQDLPRMLDTAYGNVRVEGSPKRVIALSESALDTALTLGIQPVGAVASRGSDKVSDYLQEKIQKIGIVGTARELNLESILALQPDLILAPNTTSKEIYAKLSMLAPTVVPATGSQDEWQATVALYADALGKSEAIQTRFKDLEQRLQALRAKLPADQTVSVVRWNPQGPMIMSSQIFTGQLLSSLGFNSSELANSLGTKPHSDILSLENLGKIDADWIFLATLNAKGEQTLDEARKQPAFNRLKAVSNNHAVAVDGQVWTSGTGLLAAEVILGNIEKALVP